MSWFSGKKYRRVRCENILELIKSPNANEQVIRLLTDSPPVISFTKTGETHIMLKIMSDDKNFYFNFPIGQEHEMEKRDGSKITAVYEILSDNILKQTVRTPDGKTAYFTREFTETGSKMKVEFEGSETIATIYYEVVD
ncbi:PREDICTED: uncharacterized protein LOC106121112 [Papilio xuthus]|uniref:Uncharacterized protein LOC106121112 n=1 Tax=Papilio xuthus TaxID=66420 RepID=A0A194PK50_PAPXU|nr:PREDICTED: uncharacterized protein LOC106121112 [Papilio xuthus]KPI93104.1 hypothetical protein RR46_14325 [Papilio xuthus]